MENIIEEIEEERKILCIICKNGKIGASYYSFNENVLYMYEEMHDMSPQYLNCCSLFREINPKYVLTMGTLQDEIIKILMECMTCGNSTNSTSTTIKSLPPNFFLLPFKDYLFETCKFALLKLTLASNLDESCEKKREMYIHSLVNFDYKTSIYATGALVKYLNQHWAYFGVNRDKLQLLHLHQISMKNHVLMDSSTFSALQIFQQLSHEASFKRGLQSSTREGLSVFKIFSSYCKTVIGQNRLKDILLNPINNIEELNKRLNFISFVLEPCNQEFVDILQQNIKQFSDLNAILLKVQHFQASANCWNILYKNIRQIIHLNEFIECFRNKSFVLNEFCNSISMDLVSLENTINSALDFSKKSIYGRPIIKYGLDDSLDAKKLRLRDLDKHVNAAAKLAVSQLPDFINECSIVYLPEMGHLVLIREWEENCDPDILKEYGFQFMFTLRGNIHYKNPLCVELDNSVGHLNADIISHENRIIHRLSAFVLKFNKDIRRPLQIIAFLDCLLAMATVARQNNYTRPVLNENNVHEIEECRHPLMELSFNFETNDFHSGGNYSHIKLITGPNGSGKSVYLKQMALVIYLVHIGSFVPAKKAHVGMMHSIFTRIQATESVAVRLSAFMIDIIQASHALHGARSNSLILLDEFGRGTTGKEGVVLLLSILQNFYNQNEFCAHILVSTHFHQILTLLPECQLVEHLKMDYKKENDDLLVFLYKARKGISGSFAFDIAAETGLPMDIIKRARDVFEAIKNGEEIRPIYNGKKFSLDVTEENLGNIDLDESF